MININDVKRGDLLTLRGEVTTVKYPDDWDGAYVDLDNIIRVHFDSDGDIAGDIEIIGHDPKVIKEPAGLGAVVKIVGKTTGVEGAVVKVSGYSWVFSTMPNSTSWSWDSVMQSYRVVEVISEGVEL